jgi:predicted acyl esterase
VQNGVGDNGAKSSVTGVTIAGPDTLSEEQLKKNRLAIDLEAENRHLVDDYYKSRTPDFSKITVPLLSAGNWGGMGLHTRGNFEGYLRAASKEKWLEVHGDTHFTHFYSTYGVELQKKFFAHFLKGEKSGWDQQPKVSLNIRHPHETFKLRAANEWPLANTQWTKFYLQPEEAIIDTKEPSVIADSQISYEIAGDGLTFLTPVRDYDFEITGPVAAKLFLSSETTDADVTLALRLYDPSGKEISFIGSNDPRVPVGLGWLRASHRKLDPQETKPYRPWHSHDELQPLTPGVPVELDVEILPTSIVVPKGYRLGLNVRGSDYEFDGTDAGVAHAPYPMKGVGPFTHTNASDRPANVFSGKNTLHFSSKMKPYLLLPIIPVSEKSGKPSIPIKK